MQISRFKAIELLRSTKGKIFSCEFVKKDGSLRRMVARLGVAKNLKGGKNGARGGVMPLRKLNKTKHEKEARQYRFKGSIERQSNGSRTQKGSKATENREFQKEGRTVGERVNTLIGENSQRR